MFRLKKIVSLGTSICVFFGQISAASAQVYPDLLTNNHPSQSQTEIHVDDQKCQTANEIEFRSSLEMLLQRSLQFEMNKFNYRYRVGEEWRKLEIGTILDGEVDRVVDEVRNEMSWSALWKSLSNSEKARDLANLVTERVYNSDKMKKSIEELASGVGHSLGTHLEIVTPEAANPALDCLHQFLGPRYGSTVAGVITESARKEFQLGVQGGTAELSANNLLKESSGGVAGVAILILRRQLTNLTERLGQRVVGSVLTRLVSVVAGSVGLALIAKDLWDLRYGVLPIIGEEMKSEDSKNKVQDELANSISEQIGIHLKDIAAKSTERIFTIWSEYRAAHNAILDFASRNEEFRTFLDGLRPELVSRLDEVAALILSTEGEAGILNRLGNGQLEEAINHLPEPALEIARQTRSIDLAIAWNGLAGGQIDKVVFYELFQRTSPSAFTKESLKKVLALENPLAVKRLAMVQPEIRDGLFEMDALTLSEMVRSHGEKDLSILATYITGLKSSSRQFFLSLVVKTPLRFEVLKYPYIQEAVLKSADQTAALEMLVRDPDLITWGTLKSDLALVFAGKVHPPLLWHTHPYALGGALFCLFVLFILLRRLLLPIPLKKAEKYK